jgi:hypothetical protein
MAFVGTVTAKQPVDLRPRLDPQDSSSGRRIRRPGDAPPPPDQSYIAVTFQVDEPLRGDFESTVIIQALPENNSCHYPFEIGHRYLVFAHDHNGGLETTPCDGTRPAAAEAALIRQLRAVRAGTAPADLFGLITQPLSSGSLSGLDKIEPAPNIPVQARNGSDEYRTVTQSDGSYEFRGLPPARYTVAATFPPHRAASNLAPRALNVAPGAACRADVPMFYDGVISGSVADSAGAPLSGMITAIRDGASPQEIGFIGAEVKGGRFEATHLGPGHYQLLFRPRVNGRLQSNPALTQEVELSDGGRVQDLQLRVP